jgi:simple sugar transport system substrate-binding protein
VKNGQISCNCEDNPLLGPKIEEILKKLEAGETVEKKQYVDEQIFAIKSDVTSVTVRGKEYPVVNVTDELLKKRVY